MGRTFPILLFLLFLAGVSLGCRTANWWSILDGKKVWATCDSDREYIRGFYRNDNGGYGWFSHDGLHLLEEANCCSPPASYANAGADCMEANWWGILDRNNVWANCPSGRYLQGIYKYDGDWLSYIEEGKCCRPQGHPSNWGQCYDQNVRSSFDKKGWSNCNDGYYLVGIYKGTCNRLYCIETFKCCKMEEPVINGGWSDFGDWGDCSKPCGGGKQERMRTCTNPPPSNGGAQCSGSNREEQECNTQSCSVDGGWSDFGDWGDCSRPCGGGKQERIRTCTNPCPVYGGANCSGSDREIRRCNEDPCSVKYKALGCFKQGNPPAVPEELKNFKGIFKPYQAKKLIEACAKLAKAKGYTHFGIGENQLTCFSGPDVGNTYDDGGAASQKKCSKKGLGKKGAVGVYELIE